MAYNIAVPSTNLTGTIESAVATILSIDAGTTGNTTLFTVPTGKTFVPTKLYLVSTAYNTVVVGAFAASVGVAGAAYTDLIAALAITGVSALNGYQYNAILAPTRTTALAATEVVTLKIATGITSGTLTLKAVLFGFYI